MGSRFDDWVYWHFFTVTVVYNNSHIEIHLNESCLANLSEESLTAAWISDWSLLILWSLYSIDLSLSLSLSLYMNQSQSQSYNTIDGQSASLSWNKTPIWGYDQIFITVRQLWVCLYGALSLARGHFCLLHLLLALASAVILGSEFRGTRDHILLSRIRDSSEILLEFWVLCYDRRSVGQCVLE
jgi:hypothetical protein